MKKLMSFLLLSLAVSTACAHDGVVGYWKTIDDEQVRRKALYVFMNITKKFMDAW